MGLDESEYAMDSRNSISKANRRVIRWAYLSRHRKNTLYIVTHLLSAIDKRIRTEGNLYLECSGIDQELNTLHFIRRNSIDGFGQEMKIVGISQVYSLFDTHLEMIPEDLE